MIDGHGGNIYHLAAQLGCCPDEIIDMSSNVNPLGPPPGLLEYLRNHLDGIKALPEVDSGAAVSAFAERYGVPAARILAGNGTTQFIHALPQALASRRVLILGPTYADYADACRMHRIPFEYFLTEEADGFQTNMARVARNAGRFDTVFICNPNNPTGQLINGDALESLCRAFPETRFIIDESYLSFVDREEDHTLLGMDLPNAVVLHSMSKIFRVPGLRIGFLAAPEPIIQQMKHYFLPWSVNSLAQQAVIHLMTHREETDAFVQHTRRFLAEERQRLAANLESHPGLLSFTSCTSFILIRLLQGHTAEKICAALARHRILIRNCANFEGLSNQFIRISLKTADINHRVIEQLLTISSGTSPGEF